MTVSCIPIPIPWSSGPVNVYLVDDDPLTLVDTGAPFDSNMRSLEAGLRGHRRRVEDVERLVLTHNHLDHVGLASEIVARSGCDVCAIDSLVPWLSDYAAKLALEDRYKKATMRRHGVPAATIETAIATNPVCDMHERTVAVDTVLHDGDRLEFAGRSWHVLHRPGHSPFDTVFFDERHGELFAGDHLIAHISSNALITPGYPSKMIERRPAISDYRESLAKTRELDAQVVFAGHGAEIDDPHSLIARRLEEMDKRSEIVASVVTEGPCTAYEAALRLFGSRAEMEPFLVLSEVLGHVDSLYTDRVVEQVTQGRVQLVCA